MPALAYAALLGVVVLWGSAFPVIKIGLEGLGVAHLTLMRHLVASLAFLAFLRVAGVRLRPRAADVPTFALLGFLGIFVYHTALNAGELRVSAGATSLIIASAPALTAVFAAILLGERMSRRAWAGSLTSFLGVVLIALGDGDALRFDPFAGFLVLAAVGTSLYFVLQQRILTRYRPLETTAFVTWAGTVPMVLFLPGLPGTLAAAPADAWVAAAYVGLFPSAVAYTLFTYAQSRAPVTRVATMLYGVPVVALAASWALLGEVPAPLTLVGGAIVITGIVIVQRARRAARPAPVPPAPPTPSR
ncbi:MAG: DMT family transporter [Trueperaceae bacterium]|nr:DMT family transporter [Trueperaceae bacterium]